MADGAEEAEAKKAAKSGGLGLIPMVLAIMVAVIASVGALGGAGFYLVKSGKLSLGGGATKVEAAEKAEPAKTKLVALDPLLVNLADAGGHAYLRVGIVLREEEPEALKSAKGKEVKEEKPEKGKVVINEADVMMRDVALSVVGHETADTLLAQDGKEGLKEELKKAMKERMPEVKLLDVMFTEFLVQR